MQVKLNGKVLELIQGNIIEQRDVDAIVNAANAELRTGGGVAGAIHTAAGPQLYQACLPLAPIVHGDAVITPGFNLHNKFIIHTLGPVYGIDKPSDYLLARCYEHSIRLADENGLKSIAFPALATGIFGYPIREAAEVALSTIKRFLPHTKHVQLVRMVLFTDNDLDIHEDVLNDVVEQ
ncbi:macro domain-containing protein [soil metagenome]